jgi:hypothetical protein
MKTFIKIFWPFAVSICIFIIAAFIMGVPISILWNAFCPKVFGLVRIDWVDGTLLYLLCNLLFKKID